MVSREREITDRYAKKMHAHIKWINSLSPLQSIVVRKRDILRHCLLLRRLIRDGYRSSDLPADDFLMRAQWGLVQLRRERALARKTMH